MSILRLAYLKIPLYNVYLHLKVLLDELKFSEVAYLDPALTVAELEQRFVQLLLIGIFSQIYPDHGNVNPVKLLQENLLTVTSEES